MASGRARTSWAAWAAREPVAPRRGPGWQQPPQPGQRQPPPQPGWQQPPQPPFQPPFQPAQPPPGPLPSRWSTGRRLVTGVAALVSVLVLAVSGGGWLALRYYDNKVTHVSLTFPDTGQRPDGAGGATRNILLVGSDSRTGTAGEFGEVEGQRSDTTIIAHLDADGSTTLASFPRDLWVTIPAYTDSAGRSHKAQQSKLNAAFALGGPSLLVRTIETLTKIRIDHYLQIDFVGFQRMTDALGGVTVCVKALPGGSRSNLDDKMSGWHGHVGDNTVNGEQALAFVRQRYGLPEGDLDRIRRQQQFIGVIFRSATSTSTLVNPVRLTSLLDAATSSVTVDAGTSLTDLQPLAVRLRGVGSGGVRFETVPASPGQAGGQSVLRTDPDKLAAFLADLSGRRQSAARAAGRPAITLVAATTAVAGAADATAGSCTY
ncbi:LCP family protein [Candidatus Protofrankia datiscae]|uniref:LCP family protein n=1 Tax=Candidatus Protofrankia datiscae TaxID=2716812 RepID=UPI00104121ED|nr:LCP family protein [Candidatus Protofrankia datiscae]